VRSDAVVSYPAHSASAAGAVVGRPEVLERVPWADPQVWQRANARFPVRVPRGWLDAADPTNPDDPLLRQAIPVAAELQPHPGDRPDPVGDRACSPVPWVVQKHPDRVLLLVTKRCHLYCRYCFRRDHDPGASQDPSAVELERALAWCERSGAQEAILSGGDPLALADPKLLAIGRRLRAQIPVLRVHTRAPITWPQRVSDRLAQGLAELGSTWVVVHCNHPRELTAPVRRALDTLVDAGVPLLNQAVLLRGVNDSTDVLTELSQALVRLRVLPYYLHHTDAVPGNAHLRVPAARGLALHRALASRVSGVALPAYVVDLPDGSGKMPVAQAVADGRLGLDAVG